MNEELNELNYKCQKKNMKIIAEKNKYKKKG